MRNVIGIDLGGTAIKYALVTETGKVIYESHLPSKAKESASKIIEQIRKAIDEVIEFAESKDIKLYGIGIGSPGIIDTVSGTVVGEAENLKGWKDIPLAQILKKYYDCPIYIDNDANVMGLAEASFGIAKGCTDVVFLTIGTGIGGAMIINGNLYGGYHNRGGELGHFPLIANGETCNCGSQGCFEQYASATALIRRYKCLLKENKKAIPNNIDGIYITSQFKANEPEAITALTENCDFIGHAIAGFINIFSPQKVVIGGGLSEAGDFYIDMIRSAAQKYGMKNCSLNTKIERASLGNQAGCLGAANLVFTA